jgi:hypothetical protein
MQCIAESAPTAPTKAYYVRIYTSNDNGDKVFSETCERSQDMNLLDEAYQAALKKARKATVLDGKNRWVEIELCIKSVHVMPSTNDMVGWPTKRLFMAEIDNDEKGGERPATLRSAMESVGSGYKPYDDFDSELAIADIRKLSLLFGGDTTLEHFVTLKDWGRRAE